MNLNDNKKIAKLLFEIQPHKLLFREKEMGEIRESFKRFENNESAKNLLIYGPPGSGKTTAIKIIREERKPNCIYLSGEQCNTAHSILKGITDLNYNTRERLLSEAKVKMKGNPFIISIDELNKVKRVEELRWLFNDLNTLCRDMIESRRSYTFLLITNKNIYETERFIPKDAADTLKLNKVEFKPYDGTEIKGILEDRLAQIEKEHGLKAEIPEYFLPYLSALIVKEYDGGIRTGLYVLSECLISDDFSKENITKILKKIQSEDFEQSFLSLPEQEKKFAATIIQLMDGKYQPVYVSLIVEKVKSIYPQRISQLINSLEAQGYLTRDVPTTRGMGRHRFVRFTRKDIFDKVNELTEDMMTLM